MAVWTHLHISESSMVRGDAREVVFHHGHSARKCHMPTAAEQSNTRKAQDGGHQRGVRDAAQTLDATLEAACRGRKRDFMFSRFRCFFLVSVTLIFFYVVIINHTYILNIVFEHWTYLSVRRIIL